MSTIVPVRKIRSEDELALWLLERLTRSSPRVTTTPGVLEFAEDVVNETAAFGYLVRYDQVCWLETFRAIFSVVGMSGDIDCGQKAIEFIARCCAVIAAPNGEGYLSFEAMLALMINILHYEDYLEVLVGEDDVLARSTLSAGQDLGVSVFARWQRAKAPDVV